MRIQVSSLVVAAGALVLVACGGSDAPDAGAADAAPDDSTSAEAVETETAAPATPESETAAAPETPSVSTEFASLPAPYDGADYARGKRTFALCKSCHTAAEGAGNLVGPNLYGIFGRQVGAVEGFSYSPAVEGADFVWTPEKLDEWLTNPSSFLPGNRMTFAGVRREEDRLAVIAYIMTETGYEPPAE